jgi:glutamyl-tRNA reductase
MGLNHKTAPLEIREKLSFFGEGLIQVLAKFRSYVPQGIILSTCNRTEVYVVTDSIEETRTIVLEFLSGFYDRDEFDLWPYLYSSVDTDAVRHLFGVAAGLDSMIIGEPQILGQVRQALTMASGSNKPALTISRLFHYALRAGRRVRDETNISRNSLSVSFAGAKFAHSIVGDLSNSTVLLVGTGEVGKSVGRALLSLGVGKLIVSNRTLARSKEIAEELEGSTIPFERICDALISTDVVICSTNSPTYVFLKENMLESIKRRNNRPLFVFDLAVPRDVDPTITQLENVYLYNLDDLQNIVEQNKLNRQNSVLDAEPIINEEVERFDRWFSSLEVIPVIKRMKEEIETIRKTELERALSRLPNLSFEETRVIERLSVSIVDKFLHKPIAALKNPMNPLHVEIMREVYGIGLEEHNE